MPEEHQLLNQWTERGDKKSRNAVSSRKNDKGDEKYAQTETTGPRRVVFMSCRRRQIIIDVAPGQERAQSAPAGFGGRRCGEAESRGGEAMPIAVSAAPVFFSLVSGYLRTFFFFGEALETENFFLS